MTRVFADTSFYVALLSPHDAQHAHAITVISSTKRRILTTEFVIVELANFFSRAADRSQLVTFIRHIRSHPNTLIVEATSELLERGFELFARRPDKDWSLTDCISFVVMEEYGITDALTTDRHFEQAGFKVLL